MLEEMVIWLRNLRGIDRKTYEPAHDTTYNNTCVTSKDSDQLLYPPSTDNPLYTDTQYNAKIRYNDNLTVTKTSLKR